MEGEVGGVGCWVGGWPDHCNYAKLISSASGMERGEVFYGPTDKLGSRDPMTHYDYAPDSSLGLDD